MPRRHCRREALRRTRARAPHDRRLPRAAAGGICRRAAAAAIGVGAMSRLQVLHFGKYYPPSRGGIETVVETLCRGERESADSRALVINRNGSTKSEVVDGVPVTRVGSVATIGAVSVAPMLPVWLARSRADVIVLHEPNPMALVAYAL